MGISPYFLSEDIPLRRDILLLTNESFCLLLQIELTSFVVLSQFAGGERPEIVSGKHTRKIVFFCT